MAFTDTQTKALKAKLSHRHVRTRDSHGQQLAYVEGWHVIAEANRIFGFDSWDRQTTSPECIWSANQRGQSVCFYSTKVRVTVRAKPGTGARAVAASSPASQLLTASSAGAMISLAAFWLLNQKESSG